MPRAAQPPPVLEVEGLRILRGGVPLLNGVDWRIRRGERWAIIGPNGSGKTSLLSALAGFLHASEGRIAVMGRVHGESNWQELRRCIGIVSSSVRQMVDDGESALEVIASGLFGQINYWGRLGAAQRAAAARMADAMGCGQVVSRPWAVLSQGERQRVLIGRALLMKPRLLILDEPCAGLDPAAREHFLTFMNHVAGARKGPAIVLVTHHVEEITPAFSHVLALRDGAVAAAGTKADVLTNRTLEAVFGTPVRVRKSGGRWWMKVGAARRDAGGVV
jgi:iron complex transport system ATP-binding protein